MRLLRWQIFQKFDFDQNTQVPNIRYHSKPKNSKARAQVRRKEKYINKHLLKSNDNLTAQVGRCSLINLKINLQTSLQIDLQTNLQIDLQINLLTNL